MSHHRTIDVTGLSTAQLRDQPQPMMIWADLADLVIDDRYQRAISTAGRRAIQKIADNFDWRRYQPILVAPTEGGKLAVVDGQHRAHAAALCGIEKLPAMTVPMTPSEQAAGFAAINRDQIRLSGLQIYRAELAAGSDWAIACRDVVAAAGCVLATYNPSYAQRKPGVVFTIALIRKMVAAGEGEAVTAGLRGIRDSTVGSDAEAYDGPILNIWLPAIASNQRFMRLNLARVFDSVDFEEITEQARSWARQNGGAARVFAIERMRGILSAHQREAAA